MIKTLMDTISFTLIPFLTGEKKAPNVYISNAFFLNWHQLSKSIQSTQPYLKGKCIDLGAGTAPYQNFISQYVDAYTVADYEDTRNTMFSQANSDFVQADALNLPFQDASIDTLLFTQVLEHVEDPNRALDEIHRVIKQDGILIISVPFIYQAHAEPYDFWRFSEHGIKKMLTDKNFQIEVFHYQGYLGTTLISILNGFLWQLSSRNKLLRNTLLLPILLLLFTFNNILGLLLDTIKMRAYSPNFFIIAKKT